MKYNHTSNNKTEARVYSETNNEDTLMSYIINSYAQHENNMLHYCIHFFLFLD